MQDDYLDQTVAKSGKPIAEVVQLLRNIQPRLQETHESIIERYEAAVADFQRWQAGIGTVNERQAAEFKMLLKRITELEMQDSLAFSYPNYFAEKAKQNRVVLDWTVDTSGFDPLPACLSNPATGSEKKKVQPF